MDLLAFSVVNCNDDDHAIAILPSIFKTSLSNSNSTNSSLGTGDSSTQKPLPESVRLKIPSPDNNAVATSLLLLIDSCILPSQARNKPSSNTIPFPQEATSSIRRKVISRL